MTRDLLQPVPGAFCALFSTARLFALGVHSSSSAPGGIRPTDGKTWRTQTLQKSANDRTKPLGVT